MELPIYIFLAAFAWTIICVVRGEWCNSKAFRQGPHTPTGKDLKPRPTRAIMNTKGWTSGQSQRLTLAESRWLRFQRVLRQ